MSACKGGHADIVELILDYSIKHQIDLNARDNMGWTALTSAEYLLSSSPPSEWQYSCVDPLLSIMCRLAVCPQLQMK